MFSRAAIQPDVSIGLASLYCGDAIEILPSLPAGTVDLTVTSPPYLLGKEYGEGVDDDYEYVVWLEWMERWLSVLYDATSFGGRLCLNIPLDTSRHGVKRPVYAAIIEKLRLTGWYYQTTIVWNEGTINRRTAWGSYARPSAPHVTSAVEMVVVCFKGTTEADYRRVPNGRTWDIEPEEFKAWTITPWSFPNRVGKNPHPAPFDEELPRRLIKLYSYKEDMICDPFTGSCTTNLVAERLGRRSIGIDLERQWLEYGRERIDRDGIVRDAAGNDYVAIPLDAALSA